MVCPSCRASSCPYPSPVHWQEWLFLGDTEPGSVRAAEVRGIEIVIAHHDGDDMRQ